LLRLLENIGPATYSEGTILTDACASIDNLAGKRILGVRQRRKKRARNAINVAFFFTWIHSGPGAATPAPGEGDLRTGGC
jgi:hypothetical protein